MASPYDEVRDHFSQVHGVDLTAGRGAQGIKRKGKMVVVFHKGQLLAKLSASRVQEVIAAGDGLAHDPGNGRPMKDRVLIPDSKQELWVAFCEESRVYVG